MLVKETNTISEGKMFAPGNLRATFDNPEYEKLVSYWLGEKYTLRYTGGMVPDVFQIIVKEKGAHLLPATARQATREERASFEDFLHWFSVGRICTSALSCMVSLSGIAVGLICTVCIVHRA